MSLNIQKCDPVAQPHLVDERRVERAFEAMREGRPVILVDDDDRENEADLIVAADLRVHNGFADSGVQRNRLPVPRAGRCAAAGAGAYEHAQ